MKKKVLAFLLCICMTLSTVASLIACTEEDIDVAAPLPPPSDNGGVSDVKTELEDASLREVYELFRAAIENNSDPSDLLNSYKLSAIIPEHRILGTPARALYMNGGAVSVISDESELYLAVKDGSIVTVQKTENGYEMTERTEDLPSSAATILGVLDELVPIAEEFVNISEIGEEDVAEGEDGFFYLTDGYTNELLCGIFIARYCYENQITADEFMAKSEDERSAVYGEASAVSELVSVRIGIGLKLRKINSFKLTVTAKDVSEATDGELNSMHLDATLTLNSTRTNIESAAVSVSYDSDVYGSLNADVDYSASYNTEGKLAALNVTLSVAVGDTLIAAKTTASEQSVAVIGDGTLSLELAYNAGYKVLGGDLIALSLVASAAPASLEYDDGVTVTDKEREIFLNAHNYDYEFSIRFNRDENNNGKIPIYLKHSTASGTNTGSFEQGSAAVVRDLPDEVRALLDQ